MMAPMWQLHEEDVLKANTNFATGSADICPVAILSIWQ